MAPFSTLRIGKLQKTLSKVHNLCHCSLKTNCSLRNLLDLCDGNDDGVCDHDGHGSQFLLQRTSPDGSPSLGSQVGFSQHN